MHYRTILFKLLLSLSIFICVRSTAQIQQIDTIVVDFAKDTLGKEKKEITPTLNLSALRQAVKQDSLDKVRIAQEKKEALKKKQAAQQEKKRKEKLAKEKQREELEEQKRKEQEVRAKALADKKKQKALKKKAEQESKKKEAALAKQRELEKKEQERQGKLSEQKSKETQSENTLGTTLVKPKVKQDLPKVPNGVTQKDNPYGTVRLAYDDLTSSFLLTIPTETKMHYHKNHSEHIMLIEGEGMVLMGYKTIKMKKNELIFITKGTPHKIINNGRNKLKVLSIQSPFYAGKDIIILE